MSIHQAEQSLLLYHKNTDYEKKKEEEKVEEFIPKDVHFHSVQIHNERPNDYISSGAAFTRNIFCKTPFLKNAPLTLGAIAPSAACGVGRLFIDYFHLPEILYPNLNL